ncbi:MAG: PAS domain-containing protein [Acidobacteriota bacterium]|nr:PAS domain-containing protein [Acidobacteriota bacterium]
MSLQARLTLWAVSLTALIVGLASIYDVLSEFNRQFASVRHDAALIERFTEEFVRHSTRGQSDTDLTNQIDLSHDLRRLLQGAEPFTEIAVCDLRQTLVADSAPEKAGGACPRYPAWLGAVARANWFDRIRLLWRDSGRYEIDTHVDSSPFNVKLILGPSVIGEELSPILKVHLAFSTLAIGVSMFGAFLLASIALRPLDKLSSMIDMIARGESELPATLIPQAKPQSGDEFGIVASKVSLLGQQLRGAQTEFSDLKTNVERLLEELEDAVLIFARDRRLIAAAGAVERFLGSPRTALLGHSIHEIFPQGTPLGLFLAQAVQTGRTLRNRRVPLDSGFALLSVEFLESSAAGGMLVRLRDPEATRQIGRQLQTADRLSAISRLTKGVAHEVKNPLNAILMHVELARMKIAHGDYDIEQQMEIISSEILRLDRVVKTFLDFTRPVQLNLSDVRLADFMQEIASLAGPQAAAAGIEIVEDIKVEDAIIAVDADLLKQAVLNILVNAVEAMKDGGTLRIEAALRGDTADIRIIDNGPGIPSGIREKIYDLYFTTKEGGSGIGLAMTYRIVQLHDGTIDFESEPGQGTVFSLRFPLQANNS